jgi:hypothetical protein
MKSLIVQADAIHLEAVWGVIERCCAALDDAGIRQWDEH